MIQKAIIILLLIFVSTPAVSLANGGDQRVLGNEYLINLSRSPFTPIAGTTTAMTVSFVDLQTGRIIQDDLLVRIRVGKGRLSKTFIHEERDILVKGGIFEWSYIFAEPGIHELFFDFAFVSNPEKLYVPPDFLLDVQKAEMPEKNDASIFIAIASSLIGGIAGWFIGRKNR